MGACVASHADRGCGGIVRPSTYRRLHEEAAALDRAPGALGPHPVHLHRASLGLVSVNGRPTGGIVKDVVLVKGFGKVEVDVTPGIAGLSLFHCHQQLHMDFGFKLLFKVV